MSDREFGGGADDLSLPKATVQKIVTEILPPTTPGNPAFARDARDLLINCCIEFIRMLSSEANEISEKEAKKTIAVEHIEKALKELDFEQYIPEVVAVAGDFKESLKVCQVACCRRFEGEANDSLDSREACQQDGDEWVERGGTTAHAGGDVLECEGEVPCWWDGRRHCISSSVQSSHNHLGLMSRSVEGYLSLRYTYCAISSRDFPGQILGRHAMCSHELFR